MEWIESLFLTVIQSMFSDIFAIYFLLGFLVFLVGFGLVILFAVSRILGYTTEGRVVGAVVHRRRKTRRADGEEKEVIKQTLYPVFEYQRSDGSTRQERASEGGTSTLKYRTGQAINLIVREDRDYDDVYDADNYGALYLGAALFGIGMIMMIHAGSLASALGIGILSLILILTGRLVIAYRGRKPSAASPGKARKYDKSFDRSDLHPIEYYASEGLAGIE